MPSHPKESFLLFGIWFPCSQVSDLISKIQAAYVETLEELSWMDVPSKEKAREKVKQEWTSWENNGVSLWHRNDMTGIVVHLTQAMAIKEHIGYPDHILEESNQKLDQEYAHVSQDWLRAALKITDRIIYF